MSDAMTPERLRRQVELLSEEIDWDALDARGTAAAVMAAVLQHSAMTLRATVGMSESARMAAADAFDQAASIIEHVL